MASSSGTCEIVEAEEELNSFRHYSGSSKTASAFRTNDKDPKLPMLKVAHSKYAEDDINQLFKAINLKSSSKSLDLSDQAKRDFYRKNALKKPVGHGMPYSPRSEITETVTLKKALRGLSISHASEVAAMKRLSKSSHSPGASEAGRITSLYRSVVVESNQSSPSLNKGKGSMVELCFVQEECSSSFSVKSPPCLQYTKITPSVESMAPIQKEINSALTGSGKETLKIRLDKKDKDTSLPPLSSPDNGENSFELHKEVYASTKILNKVSSTKKGRKSRLKTVVVASSSNGNTLNTKNNHRLAKPVFKKRNLGKKKSNQDLTSTACTSEIYNEINGVIDPDDTQMVCHKCQCTIKSAKAESQEASSIFHSANDINTGPCKPKADAVMKSNKNVNSKDKGEFSQSSKSSLGENSTSTSASDESNLSGSSCGNRPHMSKDVRWEAIKHVKKHHGNLGLSHFNLLKKLGCGDIGTVYLAELIGANCLFAIKVMDNEYLAKRKKMPRAQTEREILRMLDHPFLPTLFSQFTSDNLSCLVMEYCPGGDLHVLRQKQDGRKFPEQAARFYVAEVLLALEYLHMLGVVYRDLKPENILVREDGHIMLTDFDLSLRCSVSPILLKISSTLLDPPRISGPCTGSGCIDPFCSSPSCQVSCFTPRVFPSKKSKKSQKLKSEQKNANARSLLQLVAEPTDARSNSFVGTHEYLAPEIIKGEGHGSAVDWWTFGIFLYELLYGKTPFKGSGNEETLGNVVLQSLTFPDSPLVSLQARDLIRGLLVKEPEHRFGSEKGAAEIKKHPFFEGLNWALIRCVNPPELPEMYDYGVGSIGFQEKKSRFLEATGELVEFELF